MVSSSYTVTRGVGVPMRDGVVLASDVWLPAHASPVAAVLFRTPYDRSAYTTDVLRPQHCVEAGLAAVMQDMRGRFGSGGDWRPFDWQTEAEDGYDTVEWIAAQQWSSGAVGMSGLSYCGTAQLAASRLKPPHLKAIAPAMASDPASDRVEAGGALRLDLVMSWLGVTSLDWLLRRPAVDPQVAGLILAAVQDPRLLYGIRPLRGIPLFDVEDFPLTFDDVYARLNTPTEYTGVDPDIPTMHVGGWFDFSHSTSVDLFRGQTTAGNQASHLVMGPWTHSSQLPQVQGQLNFGAMAAAGASRLPERLLDFFRRHLRDESKDLPRVTYFLMNSGGWRTDEQWPPAATATRVLYLGHDGGSGILADTPPLGDAAPDQFTYDPDDPTPTVGGRNLTFGRLTAGPVSQEALGGRADVLRYRGAPVEDPLDIVGTVTATLFASTSAADTDFVVKLLDEDPHGVAVAVCTGAIRLRFRGGFDAEQPYSPGEVTRLVVPLGHTAWRVLPGHRLALQVQSADFPHLDPNPNTGEPLGRAQGVVPAVNRVFRDRERASAIELGILGATS